MPAQSPRERAAPLPACPGHGPDAQRMDLQRAEWNCDRPSLGRDEGVAEELDGGDLAAQEEDLDDVEAVAAVAEALAVAVPEGGAAQLALLGAGDRLARQAEPEAG